MHCTSQQLDQYFLEAMNVSVFSGNSFRLQCKINLGRPSPLTNYSPQVEIGLLYHISHY